MMKRREFIALLGGAAGTWPLAARAQQKLPVIGWLSSTSAQGHAAELVAFKRGLEEAGYVEGGNVAIEYRWAENHSDRLSALASDLIDRKVSVIAATGGVPSALAVKPLTSTIPIVFESAADPVAIGLVASLARPGGNLTGAAFLAVELAPKNLELLHEVLPGTSTIAALINPTLAIAESQVRELQQAARTLGLQLPILRASTDREVESAFEALVRQRAGGLVIGPSPFFTDRNEQLAALALRHAVPTIYSRRDFAAAGGLMSYGASLTDAYRLVGVYVGRILNGEKPADLPVQQATKVELTINLKTAKTLGLTVPTALLTRADEVIE
jgi:putative ABC transport system substrate-binding protein